MSQRTLREIYRDEGDKRDKKILVFNIPFIPFIPVK
jgi:hypothetical protein